MRRTAILVILIIALGSSASSQEDMEVIDQTVYSNPRRSPAVFRHDEHNESAGIDDCNTCHHVYQNNIFLEDESSEDQRCSECHPVKPFGKQLSLRKAFHQKCKGCHQKKQKGPIMCGECHKKNLMK